MKSHIGQVVSVKKEKPVASTPAPPAAAASQHSESNDLLGALTPNRPPSPRGSKTPKEEVEIDASSTEEKRNVDTGTLTPKPEVCMLYCSSTK